MLGQVRSLWKAMIQSKLGRWRLWRLGIHNFVCGTRVFNESQSFTIFVEIISRIVNEALIYVVLRSIFILIKLWRVFLDRSEQLFIYFSDLLFHFTYAVMMSWIRQLSFLGLSLIRILRSVDILMSRRFRKCLSEIFDFLWGICVVDACHL